ncbi:hypothetical protein CDAR_76531 [Caerostris darwini]|uniref:Uncharacterized protein n=1 Tax=Caerostris darwini TaxID=1538125 RepID=A0AAV4QF13_9ARAC|nr:hypothetical protein CDAR_76531 [Caerostris darwini]
MSLSYRAFLRPLTLPPRSGMSRDVTDIERAGCRSSRRRAKSDPLSSPQQQRSTSRGIVLFLEQKENIFERAMSLSYRAFLRPLDPPSEIRDDSRCDSCREDRVQEQLSQSEEVTVCFISEATKKHFKGYRFLPPTKKPSSTRYVSLLSCIPPPPDPPSVIQDVSGCDRCREDSGRQEQLSSSEEVTV